MYKTVEEYSKEMTREEFDRFTEKEELCPSAFALNDSSEDCITNDCIGCWNKALVGIEFKSPVPGLPVDVVPVLMEIQNLEIQAKEIKETQAKLKDHLLAAMKKHNVKKWDSDLMTITYVAPTTRESIDSSRLKKELPDVAAEYTKISNVKDSIKITLKKVK